MNYREKVKNIYKNDLEYYKEKKEEVNLKIDQLTFEALKASQEISAAQENRIKYGKIRNIKKLSRILNLALVYEIILVGVWPISIVWQIVDAIGRIFLIGIVIYTWRKRKHDKKAFEDEYNISYPEISMKECYETCKKYKKLVEKYQKGYDDISSKNLVLYKSRDMIDEKIKDIESSRQQGIKDQELATYQKVWNQVLEGPVDLKQKVLDGHTQEDVKQKVKVYLKNRKGIS